MRFDSVGKMEEVVWRSRLADLPRGENRAILNRTYNGEPPFDPTFDVENARQVNRNFLHGTKLLTDARRQWYSAFLRSGNYFNVTLDCSHYKQTEWSKIITKNINRKLKRNRPMMEQIRSTGASVMLHGIGPTMWKNRQDPIPIPLPICGLMIPSDTDIDFQNLEWFSVFRQWTPSQLYEMTHGPKVDPGWNMAMVQSQLEYLAEQYVSQWNLGAYQYMPEKIVEVIKQDIGFWNSDAVPTCDVWDCYFREAEDGKGWYRRIFLDWGVTGEAYSTHAASKTKPESRNKIKGSNNGAAKEGFLYSSGERVFSPYLDQILHCQFADCSSVSPFKYHSIRSLGWMAWGVCDLLNRLQCQFQESVFENLMWFFRVSSQNDFDRIKKANLYHMAVIPTGVDFVKAQERFIPDYNLVGLGQSTLRTILAENASSFTQDWEGQGSGREMTATETMARVNSVNALVSGMITLAYDYQTPQYREISRRMCIKNSPYAMSSEFRLQCLKEGVPAKYLDVEYWDIEPERTVGNGNKTLEIAQANALLQLRPNVNPDAQRLIDNIVANAYTDNPDLSDRIAPISGEEIVSNSTHDAQLATERIMRGLQFAITAKMVPEDYVKVWLNDMATIVNQVQSTTNVGDIQTIIGLGNLGQHIQMFLQIMGQNKENGPRVRQYSDALGQLMNIVKGFAQRWQEQQQAGADNGTAKIDAETQAKLNQMQILAQAKAQTQLANTAQKQGMKQATFEADQGRKEREFNSDQRRKQIETISNLQDDALRTQQDLADSAVRTKQDLRHNALTTTQDMILASRQQQQEPKQP